MVGFAEMNIDWRLVPEEAKLYYRTKEWWESVHISYNYNNRTNPNLVKQFGGTAVFSLNKAVHRVESKGGDPLNLGRWSWTRFHGKSNHHLCLISAYRPNPPSGGPFTVYAQQRRTFNVAQDSRCPRSAFIEDLVQAIISFQNNGDHIILMVDGNSDMRNGDLASALTSRNLREVILDKHGHNGPSTYRRNTSNTPIDGIWASPSINITGGGYFHYNEVFNNTDHRCLWIDISYIAAFGHNMPPLQRPKARLHNRDPRIVNNFIRLYEGFVHKHKLLEKNT
jgi:hypothetical protein